MTHSSNSLGYGQLPTNMYEYHGYFETLFDIRLHRVMGTRTIDKVPEGRELGESKAKEMILTETVILTRGIATKKFIASKEKPRRVLSSINRICGRMI